MRPRTTITMLAVLIGVSACVSHRTPSSVHETRSFPAHAGKLVRLDVRSLDVHVTVAESETIQVGMDLQVQSSSHAWARRWIERNTPVYEDSDSVLEVHLPERERHGLFFVGFVHTNGRLDLVVPPECRLEVKTSSGDVRTEGGVTLAGPVRVNTSSGDVTLTGGVHEALVQTSSGDVRVSGPALASLEVDTSSGDVKVTGGAGKTVVDTSSGDVRLEKLSGNLSADTSSGDVWASWQELPGGASVHVRTSSGDVRLRLPAGTGLAGTITTTSGRIHSAIPPAHEERRHHQMSFEAASGAVKLEVRTSSGDVSLRTGS
jgi:hypothetical protein